MEKKQKTGRLKDALIALIIAVVVLGIVIALTFAFKEQVKSVLYLDKNIILISDIIGFVAIFLISYGFLRGARKKEVQETTWHS